MLVLEVGEPSDHITKSPFSILAELLPNESDASGLEIVHIARGTTSRVVVLSEDEDSREKIKHALDSGSLGNTPPGAWRPLWPCGRPSPPSRTDGRHQQLLRSPTAAVEAFAAGIEATGALKLLKKVVSARELR